MKPQQTAIKLFLSHGGTLRTGEAIGLGIHPRTLYALVSQGQLSKLRWGCYQLVETPPSPYPDLTTAALALPQVVVCLISALAFHNMTSQIPHQVDVAYRRGTRKPSLSYPPLRPFCCSEPAFSSGVEKHQIDGVWLRITSPEKTVVDCFKFRSIIGIEVAIEALRIYCLEKPPNFKLLRKYAIICRVDRIMQPYLETILHA